MDKLTIGVVFGGVSPEHEVSIISSLQAAAAFDRSRFEPVPIYIGKDGRWYTGDDLLDIERYRDLNVLRREARRVALQPGDGGTLDIVETSRGGFFHKPWQCRIDVLFLGLHGGAGEDGGVQGLCKALNIPFTGSDVLGSAIERYRDLNVLRREARRVALQPGDGGTLDIVETSRGGFFHKPWQCRIDVLFLGLHGGAGEDGGVQGLCKALNIPFTGSDVLGSAIGIDKVVSKYLCRDAGTPIVDFVAFRESDWVRHEDTWLDRIEEELGYPVIVKPARLGSSIGIARAKDRASLDAAIEEALRYDDKIVVEDAVEPLREINCAVLGNPDEALPSVLEQPVKTEGEDLLTYQEKYMRGGGGKGKGPSPRRGSKQRSESSAGMASLDRIIPAPLDDEKTREIQDLAVRIFKLFECSGVARIDFMINDDTGKVYFNEINTIPGSFSFYLWEPTGIGFQELTTRMIELALERHRMSNGRIRSYDVNLLSQQSLQGLLGTKK